MQPAKVFRALAWLWGRTPMPNPWSHDPTRRAIGRYLATRFGTPVWLGSVVCWTLWIPRAVALATAESVKHARDARKAGAGPGLWQWFEQIGLAWRRGSLPEHYYHYRLFDPAQRPKADGYLANHHAHSLCTLLDTRSADALNDKFALEQHLLVHGVASVQTLATAEHGVLQRQHWASARLPPRDLVIKPNSGRRGEGFLRIRHHHDDRFEIDGRIHSGAQVLRHFQDLSLREHCLLQPCLVNHPQLAPVAPDSLSTVRLITGRRPSGQVQVIIATLRIAPAGAAADNFSAGGWAAPIALTDGRLGPAVCKRALSEALRVQPRTGAVLADTRVPDWPQVQDTAVSGHRSLSGFVFLAWDIAITPDGPAVIEVNSLSHTMIVQKPGLRPLSQTVLAEVAHAWLQDRQPTRHRHPHGV